MSNRNHIKLGTFLLGPLISLPGQAPMSTTLTTLQLCALFPTLHTYMLPSNPLITILPYNSTTHHGLKTILSWTEHQIAHPEATFDAELPTLIAVHQTLSFLGNAPQRENMVSLDAHIRADMQKALTLDDIQEVWAMHYLPFTEPWIDLLLTHLAAFCVRVEAKFAHPGLPARMLRNRDLRRETRAEMRVLNWLLGVERLFERVERVDGRVDRARLWRLKEEVGERMVGPYFPGRMGVIVEEEEEMMEDEEDEEMVEEEDEELEGMMARMGVDEVAEDADDEASSDEDEKSYFVEDGFASLDEMVLDV